MNEQEGGKREELAVPDALSGMSVELNIGAAVGQQVHEVIWDQSLLEEYYDAKHRTTVPVTTAQSNLRLTPDDIAYEILNGFISHNPLGSGSPEGVTVRSVVLPDGETRRFTITGPWAIYNPEALLSPHVQVGPPQIVEGHPAVGLKQAVAVGMRDCGLAHFEVQGSTWDVQYALADTDAINRELESAGHKERLKGTWLSGDVFPSGARREACGYVVETKNPALIAAFDSLQNAA